jgi:hypothetical protein
VGWVPEEATPTAVIRRGAAATVMGAWCPSGGEHGDGGLGQREREVGDKVFLIGFPRFFLDILLFLFLKCLVTLTGGPNWSEIALILLQFTFSLFCKKL